MAVKHSHQSAIVDNPAFDVSSARWNADHTVDDNTLLAAKLAAAVSGILFGRSTALAGAGEEITVGNGLTMGGGLLVANPPPNPGQSIVYLDDTAFGTGGLFSLLDNPAGGGEVIDGAVVNNSMAFIEGYVGDVLPSATIPAGEWTLDVYAEVTNTGGGNYVVCNVCKRMVGAGTLTITGGPGTSRTATIAGGTPFLAADANADMKLAGRIETPTATFQITAFSDDHTVTVEVTAGYVNEGPVAYAVHRWLFAVQSPDIPFTTLSLIETVTVQPAFLGIGATDRLSTFFFAYRAGAGNRTISYSHNGTLHYTHVHTPIATTISTGPITTSGLTMASARLLGRTTATVGAIEEISAGASLSLATGTLDAVQDIRTSATPQFAGLALGIAWTRALLELRSGSLYLSDPNVAHGMTGIVPTDVYGQIKIRSATDGGLEIGGFTDAIDTAALFLGGYVVNDTTAAGKAVVNIAGSRANGTSNQALAATGKLLTVNNYTTNDLFTILGSGFIGFNQPAPRALIEMRSGSQYFSDPNVAHGMTAIFPTDVFGVFGTVSPTAGGLLISGLSDTGNPAMYLNAYVSVDTTTAGLAAIVFQGQKASGTGAQALAATGKLLTVNNYTTSDLFTILGSGNVGVSQAAPSSSLQVSKIGQYGSAIGVGWGDFSITDQSVGIGMGVAPGGGGAGDCRIWAKGGTEKLILGNATNGDVIVIHGTRVGIAKNPPLARLHLPAGTATANTGPLKIDAGVLMTVTEAGSIENDGTHLYYTATAAGPRYQLDQQAGGVNQSNVFATNKTLAANDILYIPEKAKINSGVSVKIGAAAVLKVG